MSSCTIPSGCYFTKGVENTRRVFHCTFYLIVTFDYVMPALIPTHSSHVLSPGLSLTHSSHFLSPKRSLIHPSYRRFFPFPTSHPQIQPQRRPPNPHVSELKKTPFYPFNIIPFLCLIITESLSRSVDKLDSSFAFVREIPLL